MGKSIYRSQTVREVMGVTEMKRKIKTKVKRLKNEKKVGNKNQQSTNFKKWEQYEQSEQSDKLGYSKQSEKSEELYKWEMKKNNNTGSKVGERSYGMEVKKKLEMRKIQAVREVKIDKVVKQVRGIVEMKKKIY